MHYRPQVYQLLLSRVIGVKCGFLALFYLLWHPKARQYIGELREPLVRTLMVEDMWLCAMIETPRN